MRYFLVISLFISLGYSGTFLATGVLKVTQNCSLRDSHQFPDNHVTCGISNGEEYFICGAYADFYEVLVLDVVSNNHVAIGRGWLWQGSLADIKNYEFSHLKKISTHSFLRQGPKTGTPKIMWLKSGTLVYIIRPKITWYWIERNPDSNWMRGWVCVDYVDVISFFKIRYFLSSYRKYYP